MIHMLFHQGGAILDFKIHRKQVIFKCPQLNHYPILIDPYHPEYDKYEKMYPDYRKAIALMKRMKSDAEIAEDFKKDFEQSGWRLLKRT